MHIDRDRAARAFERYVERFDPQDPKIALKVEHTWRVADLAEKIARSLLEGASPEYVDLAWLLGLLHDVGRFEQVRRYGTFNDAASTSHAALGARVLFDGLDGAAPTIRDYVAAPDEDGLLVDVGVEHARLLQKRALDRLRVGVALDAQNLVIVFRGHSYLSPTCRTSGRGPQNPLRTCRPTALDARAAGRDGAAGVARVRAALEHEHHEIGRASCRERV